MIIEVLKENSESLEKLLEECFFKKVEKIDIKDSLNKNIRFLCALDNNEVVGTIMITTKFNPVRNTKEFYLDYVCVKPSCRGKGIGKSLLLKTEEMAKEENVKSIVFTSNPSRIEARNMYLNNGYIIRDSNLFYKDMV
jgi:ribosomal protein S18 acetylase RimI-like enzyme